MRFKKARFRPLQKRRTKLHFKATCVSANSFLNFAIDIFFQKRYNYWTFPDCVMVALQILVLTVGVRILLGEKAANRGFLF